MQQGEFCPQKEQGMLESKPGGREMLKEVWGSGGGRVWQEPGTGNRWGTHVAGTWNQKVEALPDSPSSPPPTVTKQTPTPTQRQEGHQSPGRRWSSGQEIQVPESRSVLALP